MAPRDCSRSRSLVLGLLFLALSCAPAKRQPVQASETMQVAVAVVFDEDEGYATGRAPASLTERVADALGDRNLQTKLVDPTQLTEPFAKKRTTGHRLAYLDERVGDVDLVLLLETKAVYYSHLNGRYRWTVHVRATLSAPGNREQMAERELEYAAFLDFDHERGTEALDAVSARIANAVGRLADDFLEGLGQASIPVRYAGPIPPKSPPADTGDVIYFVMVDRFANGDPSNDGEVDADDPQAFHGGDLQGVIDNLDHLQELGVRTVWLSPIFEMQHEKFHGHGAYHGYWVMDLGELEPRFGSEATLKKLAEELHARDMRLMLDIVVNHVGFQSPLREQHPEWFHHNGGVTDWNDPVQLVTHDVHGLPDFDQSHPEVYEYLLSRSKKWIDLGVDGFRLDAVKHVPGEFWRRYNADLRAHAGADFELLGEDLNGDPRELTQTFAAGSFGSMFDFPLHFAMVDTFCRDRGAPRLASMLYADRLYEDPSRLVTLLDNHDLPRVLSVCGGDVEAVKNAYVFMLTARGTPSFNYGTESGLTGEKEPDNRGDMRFDSSHPLYAHLRTWLGHRRTHRALRDGRDVLLEVSREHLVYARVLPSQAAIITVNRGERARRVDVPKALRGRAVELATGAKVRRKVSVPAGSVRVVITEPARDGAFVGFGKSSQPVTLEVRAPRALSDGQRLLLVGSDPALGFWDPSKGVEVVDGAATVELASGGVYELKLVVVDEEGNATWEEGANRCVFVEPQSSRHTLEARWGRTGNGECS